MLYSNFYSKIWTALKRAQPVFLNVEMTWNPSRMSPVNCSAQVRLLGLIQVKYEILLSAQCNEDNYCSFWSFQEHMDTAEKRCFLMQVKMNESDRHKAFCFSLTQMQSCEKATVAPYPWITSSGSRECLPEEYKRRKCRPGCGSRQALLWDKEYKAYSCYSASVLWWATLWRI